MRENRLGAIALIIGAISGIVVLTFHPGGGGGSAHRVTPAQFEILIGVIVGVHVLAISGLPFCFLGATALSRKIDTPNRVALVALVVYGFSLLAMMIAATMSGLITPALLRKVATHAPDADQWHMFSQYTHTVNQAFAQIGALGTCVAIILWSVIIIKRRVLSMSLGIYGVILGLAILVCFFAGKVDLELHGFQLITLAQSIWFVVAGIFLWRAVAEPTGQKELLTSDI
ncbi:MAG TPA: hypothetical protein VFA58_03900 [Chthoniobacterales bacterium]|nr:hypothetical protein [Chthoniobacterales bacterium]